MRWLGRGILLVVGIALIAAALPIVVSNINEMNGYGWGLQSILDHMPIVTSLLTQIVNISFGLTAIFAFIRGRASFKLFITSLVMIAPVVWHVYTLINADTTWEWQLIVQIALEFALPIAYFIGMMILLLSPRHDY